MAQPALLRLLLGAVVVLLGLVAVGGPALAQEDDSAATESVPTSTIRSPKTPAR